MLKSFVTLVLIMAGCGSPVPPLCQAPDVGASEQAIVNGTPSVDRRGTVYVSTATGYCSGTIVGPHTVLTAGHCTDPQDFRVDGVAWFEVNQHITHPEYTFPRSDLQVIHTFDVLPEPYVSVGLNGECSSLLAQGYGIGSGGELHERTVVERDRHYGVIETGEGICNGDSGGPLYARNKDGYTLVGVASFGTSEPGVCLGGMNGFVDLTLPVNADWILENLT